MPSTGPKFPHGFEEKFSVALETTFDTDAAMLAADAVAILDSKITPENVIISSLEKTGNRMPPSHFKGLRSGKGSVNFYSKPGAVGVEPDYGPIYEAALATKTIVGGTSVTYAHTDSSAVKTLRMARNVGDGLSEHMLGAVVESLAWDIVGGQPTKVSASFAGARVARAKTAVLTTAFTLGGGTCAVAAGEGTRFEKGTLVRFRKAAGTFEDNGGLGYMVTSDALDAIVVTPVAVSTAAIGDEIQAFLPTPVTTGTVTASVDQDILLAGVSIPFVSAKVTYKSGLKPRGNEGQSNRPTGALSGSSSVDGEILAYMREDMGMGNFSYSQWDNTYKAITVRSGAVGAGLHEKLVIANALLQVSEMNVPGSGGGPTMFALKFTTKTAFSVLLD